MPLIKGKSKQAFSKNVATEMNEGKPQAQSLAIAYDVKKRNQKRKQKKMMAEGGEVNESAKSEHRPMPDERDKDSKMISRNSGDKPASHDDWSDRSTVEQAQRPSITPLSRPKFANGIYKVRDRDDVVKEEMMMDKMAPDGYANQPDKEYDEEGPDRQGPKISDMEDEHSTHRKPYAKGGEVEASDYSHPENKYEDDLLDIPPSEDEGSSMARSHDEEDANGHNPNPLDMESEHSNGRRPYAMGGSVEHEMDDQPMDEEEEEHHDSIAAAIMAKKERQMRLESGSKDMDHMVLMYEGGQVEGSDDSQADIMPNGEEHPNGYYKRNEDEVLKENYMEDMRHADQPMDSNEMGDEREAGEENEHDMISQIRSKMNRQRQFKSK